MNKIKVLVLPLLLGTLVGCSNNKFGVKEVAKSAPFSYYEKMSYNSTSNSSDYNYTKLTANVIPYNQNEFARISDSNYIYNSTTKGIFDLRKNKEVGKYAEGFSSVLGFSSVVSNSVYIRNHFSTYLLMYTSFENDKYTIHIIINDSEYTKTSSEKFSITFTGNQNNFYNYYINVTSNGSTENVYIMKDKIVDSDYYYDYKNNLYPIYNSQGKVVSQFLRNSTSSVYDVKGNYISSFDMKVIWDSLNSVYEYIYLDIGCKAYIFGYDYYFDSLYEKNSKDQFKVFGYEIDYSKGTVKKSENLNFIVDNYWTHDKIVDDSYICDCAYVTYRLLDENGIPSTTIYGTLIDDNTFNFDGSYLADEKLMSYDIYKIKDGEYLVDVDATSIYVTKNNLTVLNGLSNYCINGEASCLYFSFDKKYVEFNKPDLLKTFQNYVGDGYDYISKSFNGKRYKGNYTDEGIDLGNNLIINDSIQNLLYFGLLVKDNKLVSAFGDEIISFEAGSEYYGYNVVSNFYEDFLITIKTKNSTTGIEDHSYTLFLDFDVKEA